MKSFVLLPLLCLAAFSAGLVDAREWLKMAQAGAARPKIVGGQNVTSLSQRPWTVIVDAGTRSNCGGFFIESKDFYIVTAAHCVIDFATMKSIPVVVTANSLLSDGFVANKVSMSIAAENVKVHPNFTIGDENVDNNIALIKPHFTFPAKTFGQVKLAKSSEYTTKGKVGRDFTGEKLSTTGWGRTNGSEEFSNVLKMVNTTAISTADCVAGLAAAGVDFNLTDQFLCTMTAPGGLGLCDGDAGGALVYRDAKAKTDTAVGVAMFGGCDEGYPNMFVRMSPFLGWIEKVLSGKA